MQPGDPAAAVDLRVASVTWITLITYWLETVYMPKLEVTGVPQPGSVLGRPDARERGRHLQGGTMTSTLYRRLTISSLLLTAVVAGRTASAQTPANDPSEKLRSVLPAEVAEHVLARIAEARARQLPAAALEHRATELATKGARPEDVERGVDRYADQLERGRSALVSGGRAHPADSETTAAAAALASGVDGSAVSALAKSAPSGRSLAVPLFVLSDLTARGLPSDEALARVQADMQARATDRELQEHAGRAGDHGKPDVTGPDQATTKRPASAGKPATLPASGGPVSRPAPAGRGRP